MSFDSDNGQMIMLPKLGNTLTSTGVSPVHDFIYESLK